MDRTGGKWGITKLLENMKSENLVGVMCHEKAFTCLSQGQYSGLHYIPVCPLLLTLRYGA